MERLGAISLADLREARGVTEESYDMVTNQDDLSNGKDFRVTLI